MKPEKVILTLAYKFEGNWDRIYKAIQAREYFSEEEYNETPKLIKSDFVTLTDENYPAYLKHGVSRPPFALFYKGDIGLIKNTTKNIAIIGSRKCSEYGVMAVRKIIHNLPKDVVIVSGLARGIDSVAHEEALKCGLKTIAVLGSGINNCYPKENQELYDKIIENGGLVVSEYPNECEPKANYFPLRNRIIAILSDFLLVAEAYSRSGTSITVNYALSSGKNVGCIPYPINKESFCNQLIKDGAYLIEKSSDIMEFMNPDPEV